MPYTSLIVVTHIDTHIPTMYHRSVKILVIGDLETDFRRIGQGGNSCTGCGTTTLAGIGNMPNVRSINIR